MVVVDLPDERDQPPLVQGIRRVAPVRPERSSPAIEAVRAAGERVVGALSEQWLTRTGAERYLPDLLASAFRIATGAAAGFVLPNHHGIQAPIDGVIGALGPGPVTELDLLRMVAALDYDPVVVELREASSSGPSMRTGRPRTRATSRATTSRGIRCRMPAGVSRGERAPASLA